jgi:hypothetical protein
MASNLACEGLLAAVRVLGLIKGLSTGLREVVGPEKLIGLEFISNDKLGYQSEPKRSRLASVM